MPDHYADIRDHLIERLRRSGGGASYRQLLDWGAERWTIPRLCAEGVLVRIERGHYVLPWAGATDNRWSQRRSEHLRSVAARAASETVAGLRSGALAWGLPVSSIPARAELLRPPGSGYLRSARTIRRLVDPDHITDINGVPVTSLARTAVDVALDLPTPKALITVDAVLRRGTSRRELLSILDSLGSTRGCRRARQTIEWAEPHAESALESGGRGELLIRGAPRPWCNVSFRLDDTEFRVDNWWPGIPLIGEADGALKYSNDVGAQSLWQEKLRQEWFEDELGLAVFRYIDTEVRLTPDALFARWERKAARASTQLWRPPERLEVFQRPVPGSDAPWTWLRRPHDLGTANSA